MTFNLLHKITEVFSTANNSLYKKLPVNHPSRQYKYTLVGFNNKPLSISSLHQLGFLGKIRNSSDFITLDGQMLFKDIHVVIQIAKFFNIPRIRKYNDTKFGIDWEGYTEDIYKAVMEPILFKNSDDQ